MTGPVLGTLLAGRYRLDRLLGSGGMGAVYVALDEQLGREVAVKLFHGTEASTRFVMEARAMARVEHPNVVGIFDVAVHEGAPFLVMERLRGESLEARWERAPMGTAELLAVFVGVCDGVAAAHRAGIVHRDLKPANVFLCRGKDGSPRPPKVLDFGVAKVNDAHLTSLSVAGVIVGSPRFMAPEQLRGAPPVPALDVYALGVMAYRGVTGRLPFDHPELMPLIAQIERAAPTPIRALAPGVSPSLAGWIEAAMARDVATRPTLGALREGLEAERGKWTAGELATLAVSDAPEMSAAPVGSTVSRPGPPSPVSLPAPGVEPSRGVSPLLVAVGAGVLGLLILASAFLAAGLYFANSRPARTGGPAVGLEPSTSSTTSDSACQGRSFFGELDGLVQPGHALCRLADPSPAARVSLRTDGCDVPEGEYEVYYEGTNGRMTLTHLSTLTSFSIGLEVELSGRVDLSAIRRRDAPFYITLVRDGHLWDNGISNPGNTSGQVTIERYHAGSGRLHLRLHAAQLSDSGGGRCTLEGEVRAVGYTASFPGERSIVQPR